MDCRPGCGACCIAPSITSPIPGMPHGKLLICIIFFLVQLFKTAWAEEVLKGFSKQRELLYCPIPPCKTAFFEDFVQQDNLASDTKLMDAVGKKRFWAPDLNPLWQEVLSAKRR